MKTIQLTRGAVTVVDDDDYPELVRFKWHLIESHGKQYAARRTWDPKAKKRGTVLMHRQIMGAPPGLVVDHDDHDGLNNRRRNLAVCTNAQNVAHRRSAQRNNGTSRFVGVARSHHGKWQAKITKDRKQRHLGYFNTPEEAAKAYNEAARELFGKFAAQNAW